MLKLGWLKSNLVNNKNDLIYHPNISDCIYDSEIIYITVPTPSKLDGSFSNEVIIEILDQIADDILKSKIKLELNKISSQTFMKKNLQKISEKL